MKALSWLYLWKIFQKWHSEWEWLSYVKWLAPCYKSNSHGLEMLWYFMSINIDSCKNQETLSEVIAWARGEDFRKYLVGFFEKSFQRSDTWQKHRLSVNIFISSAETMQCWKVIVHDKSTKCKYFFNAFS